MAGDKITGSIALVDRCVASSTVVRSFVRSSFVRRGFLFWQL